MDGSGSVGGRRQLRIRESDNCSKKLDCGRRGRSHSSREGAEKSRVGRVPGGREQWTESNSVRIKRQDCMCSSDFSSELRAHMQAGNRHLTFTCPEANLGLPSPNPAPPPALRISAPFQRLSPRSVLVLASSLPWLASSPSSRIVGSGSICPGVPGIRPLLLPTARSAVQGQPHVTGHCTGLLTRHPAPTLSCCSSTTRQAAVTAEA